VIVARVFPGPLRDTSSNKAFDPSEPHGTHVSGIAAGDEGTTAPAGPDHPATANLAGVAPRAWIGNYRVFTVPTPIGHEANTPEIVQAFEAAVSDGMNVINFSGGGPETDPANDAMNEAVHNAALAGVVPVIAAGNDRDDFGLGSAGSPGTAPDAISVAAVSNSHVFAPALSVVGGPASLGAVPIQAFKPPTAWAAADQTLVDVASVVGTDGKPVDPYLCGPTAEADTAVGTLPKDSLTGKIVLVRRGICSFVSKAERAVIGGAEGIVLTDNRAGEANPIPVPLPIPGGMISDLDGAQLRAFIGANGGQAKVRVSTGVREIQTNRSGVITSFSSAGPTDFEHRLKPDISAPGLDVLSSTPPSKSNPSPFSVYAGTSMAAPHVAGAAALLLQRHPGWSSWQVKSALMSTAGPAWGDSARTQEASVLLEGAGLANALAADDPKVFTDPQSLSFERVDVSTGAQRASLLLTVTDAGDGAGTWNVSVAPQAATAGVTIDVPGQLSVTPGGDVAVPVVVRAAAGATTGENSGFVVLSSGGVQRRVPYSFLVERPGLRDAPVTTLRATQIGDTASGPNRVAVYCCPAEPFGPPPTYTGAPMNEDGSEHLYVTEIDQPVVNFGVSILAASTGALIDPFVLGSKDENDVQGYAGIPTDVNSLTFDASLDVGAAGVQFPRLQRFYVAVDSRANEYTNRPQKGKYLLNAWANDVTPPAVQLLTTHVTAGRPLIVARASDLQSGVDPLSLVLAYNRVLVGASLYDPASGLIVFGLPAAAPKLKAGRSPAIVLASDFQEAKNIDTVGNAIMPNTTFLQTAFHVVSGPTVSWIEPAANVCALKRDTLLVVADSTSAVRRVVFRDGRRQIGVDASGSGGIYSVQWKTSGLATGRRHLTATVVDSKGGSASAALRIRIC
jgi:subtilisin family serine protease